MSELPKSIADIVHDSVGEGFTLYEMIVQQAEMQAQAEPERFHVDMILQIVWGRLNERFMSNGWSAGELAAKLMEDHC